MKISVNWLKELVPIKWTEEQLIENLSMLGFPVENAKKTGIQISNVVAVKILTVEKHPNADRLQIAKVFDGKEERTIVCGAPNIAPGQIVPCALPGAKMKEGFEITISKIRGIESFGMLCSERELGLSESHAGILQLDPNAKLGRDVRDILGGSDTILEIEVTPNRPDVLSHVGLAREIAAFENLKIKWPAKTWKPAPKSLACKIQIKEPSLCFRYTGKVITNVTVGASPQWMVSRLNACGIRSINNIVDITNYVLLEWGHPLHAFDLEKLAGQQIVVRRAVSNEKFLALDEKTYSLTPDDLVIADAEKTVAIAGIMGGQDTGVTSSTKNILLESAVFDRVSVRKSSRRLGLKSESSIRFEKGTDAQTAESASLRAAQIIMDLAGGIPGGQTDAWPKKSKPVTISLRTESLENLSGRSYEPKNVERILKSHEFTLKESKVGWTCVVPAHRKDIALDVDLIEEVVRMTGYDAVPETLPPLAINTLPASFRSLNTAPLVDRLQGFGLNETMTSSFCSSALAENFGFHRDALVPLLNPLSQEESVMRPAVYLTLLNAVSRNINFQRPSVALFEMGKNYSVDAASGKPIEKRVFSFVIYGNRSEKSVHESEQFVDFFQLKGIATALLAGLANRNISLIYSQRNATLHPNQSFELIDSYTQKRVGWGGLLHPSLASSLGFKKPCALFEMDVDAMNLNTPIRTRSTALPKFPFVERDIAILVEKNKTWDDIRGVAAQAGGALLKNIYLFDLFSGGNLSPDQKSVAFRLTLQHDDHTLADAEINAVVDKIKSSLIAHCGAQIR